ncbi:MAG TPA: hypothetical protein V6C81_17825 [Planktothrix sp.]|jgi:hypothetical protein
MASEEHPEEKQKTSGSSFVKQWKNQLTDWLKETNPELHDRIEVTLDSAAQIADQGIESAKASLELVSEFTAELTGIESFRIIPKSSMAVEVDIRCKQNQQIPVKQYLAPFVELKALALGRRINFEALVNKTKKGLQLDVNDGMALIVEAPLVGPQTIPVKGSALLMRDNSGHLVLAVTSNVPGIEEPVTINIPLRHVASNIQTQIKKKFSGD